MHRREFVSLLVAGTAAARQLRGAPEPDLRTIEHRIFEAVNNERLREHVPPLQWNEKLADEARTHSGRMVAYWFFAHSDPLRGELSKRLAEAGIHWHTCAENIFYEQGYRDPVAIAIESWLGSPGHRANIVHPRFTHSGSGAAQRVDGTLFITQEFVSR